MDVDDTTELLRLLDLANRIKNIDLEGELEKRRTPVERLVRELGDEKLVQLKRKPEKKKLHWRTRKKKEKELYHNYRKPKAQQRKVALLKGGSHGWWVYVKEGWDKQKKPVTLTEEEFTQVLWPVVEGKIPQFRRYDTEQPVSLTNIYAVDVKTGKVLFDGKEYQLRLAGHIL
jgi:hypothetical protein